MIENLSDLRLFIEVVRTGNISRAGKSLNFSAAVATKRLQRLEDALDMQLVHRTTRKVSPTQAGQDLYKKALEIIEQLDELGVSSENVFPQSLRGRLRVSSPVSFGTKYVAPCLSAFLKTYTNMQIDLVLDDMRSDILAQGIDLAISIAPLKLSNFIVRKIADNRKVLVTGPDYIKTYGQPETVKNLAQHNCLVLGAYKNWTLIHRENRKEERVTVASNFSSNSGQATVAAAKAGLGICIKSWWDVADDLKSGSLVQVLPDYELFSDVNINIIYPSKKHFPQKTEIMLEFLIRHLRENLG